MKRSVCLSVCLFYRTFRAKTQYNLKSKDRDGKEISKRVGLCAKGNNLSWKQDIVLRAESIILLQGSQVSLACLFDKE
jgi:hypothetical protein